MNRGVLESYPVQQIMAGNPNLWSINSMRQTTQEPSPPPFRSFTTSSSSTSYVQCPQPAYSIPSGSWHENQDLPESWSQLLMGGLVSEEDRCNFSNFQAKKMENWEDQVLFPSASSVHMVGVKQETTESGHALGHGAHEESQAVRTPWGQVLPASSPRSCVTSFSSNMLDFSNSKVEGKHQESDHSSECNSTATGGPFKKAKIQCASAQSTFKVRKEKLGDRITALHQLVSPFGKTDTASVLLEAIGYIRFLQSQIEGQGERSCIFPEDPGQLLNDSCNKRSGASEKGPQDGPKNDLRSRGLCLVPVSCTLQVGSDNGADYWATNLGAGFR
ncbi:transcription factor bHLH68-like isoform X2 [Magnolia sinica]|uniref:transcription factor bHLH68-like isoform X2 n=1 Tax=Magnolia sinica TaxID=86752 RepID=UPI00265943F3|nr:transcription factor bHLH68-like isoform X2 [Magnolia sinica]